jgi:CspA family cold shock protein
MIAGTVKWYREDKGFGFIARDDGDDDVFVHASTLQQTGVQVLNAGQRVRFEIETYRGRPRACDVERSE